jgi:hypothetical protein
MGSGHAQNERAGQTDMGKNMEEHRWEESKVLMQSVFCKIYFI